MFSPVPRPLWVEFPDELETFGVEDEYMLGEQFLINYSHDKYYNYVLVIVVSGVRALKKIPNFSRKPKNKRKFITVTFSALVGSQLFRL